MKRLVIVDGLNLYLRNYIVNPMVSTHGYPIGGLVGTLNSIKKIIRDIQPDKLVIAWDGSGGSQKRRQTVKEYKQGRKPLRKNYKIDGMSEQTEKENMVWQQQTLMEMINEMPIMQLVLEFVEADDIISMVAKSKKFAGWQKVIVSSDKDFIQLLDNEIVLFRPIQNEVMSIKTVTEEFGISPENFVIARAIAGDKSDNLSGVKGAGLQTISKRLEFLKENKMFSLSDVYNACLEYEGKVKFYSNVIEEWDKVETNYKVMNLTPPNISAIGAQKINYILNNFTEEINATELKRASVKHGFGSYEWSEYHALLRGMIEKNKQLD